MAANKIKSHAKINLVLNITGKGFLLHRIESVVAFVSLHDVISIKKINSDNHKILFSGMFANNIGKNNTVSHLLRILEKKKLLGNLKYQIKINKHIPSQSGLGGGSMNAANILRYFLKKKIIKISKKEIGKICMQIGSDVILGLSNKNTILTSKNIIKNFSGCAKIYTLIVKPNFGCSTKDIYSLVKKYNKPLINKPHKKIFDLETLKKMENSLEKVVLSKYPQLRFMKSYLEKFLNPVFVRMTGSGSALVAYYRTKKRCENAKKMFSKKYKNCWCIASKTI